MKAQYVSWSVLDVTLGPYRDVLVYSSWSESLHQLSLTGYKDKHEDLPLHPEDRLFSVSCLAVVQ